jgi:hypothetical protein
MNAYPLRFSVFNGDWKAGSGNSSSTTPSKCSNDLYAQSLGYLNSLNAPAVYTPGDNEWTDCDRKFVSADHAASASMAQLGKLNAVCRSHVASACWFSADLLSARLARQKIKE